MPGRPRTAQPGCRRGALRAARLVIPQLHRAQYADYTAQTFGKHREAYRIERNGRSSTTASGTCSGAARAHRRPRQVSKPGDSVLVGTDRPAQDAVQRRVPLLPVPRAATRRRTTSRWTRASPTRDDSQPRGRGARRRLPRAVVGVGRLGRAQRLAEGRFERAQRGASTRTSACSVSTEASTSCTSVAIGKRRRDAWPQLRHRPRLAGRAWWSFRWPRRGRAPAIQTAAGRGRAVRRFVASTRPSRTGRRSWRVAAVGAPLGSSWPAPPSATGLADAPRPGRVPASDGRVSSSSATTSCPACATPTVRSCRRRSISGAGAETPGPRSRRSRRRCRSVLVGPPVMGVPDDRVHDIFEEFARDYPNTPLRRRRPSRQSGPDFAQYLPCLDEEPCTGPVVDGTLTNVVRAVDKVHFCPDPGAYGRKCDVYSSGAYRFAVTLYETITGDRAALDRSLTPKLASRPGPEGATSILPAHAVVRARVVSALTRDIDEQFRPQVIEYVEAALRSMPEHLAGGSWPNRCCSASIAARARRRRPVRRRRAPAVARTRSSRAPIDPLRQYPRLLSSLVLLAQEELVPEAARRLVTSLDDRRARHRVGRRRRGHRRDARRAPAATVTVRRGRPVGRPRRHRAVLARGDGGEVPPHGPVRRRSARPGSPTPKAAASAAAPRSTAASTTACPADLADEWRTTYAIDEFSPEVARPLRRADRSRARRSRCCPGAPPPSSAILERGATKLGWRAVEFSRVFRYEADGRGGQADDGAHAAAACARAGARGHPRLPGRAAAPAGRPHRRRRMRRAARRRRHGRAHHRPRRARLRVRRGDPDPGAAAAQRHPRPASAAG